MTAARSPLGTYGPPAIMLAISIGFLNWSYSYDEQTRQVPALVGWCMVVLCVLDVIAVSETAPGNAIKKFFTGRLAGDDDEDHSRHTIGRVLVAMAWPLGFVAFVALFGFMPVIPVYVFLFVAVQGRKGVRKALYAAVSISVFIYVVFELLLRYEVYRGALFAG